MTSTREFQQVIEEGDENGDIICFIELGIYVHMDGSSETDMELLKGTLSEMNTIGGEYFEKSFKVISYLTFGKNHQ